MGIRLIRLSIYWFLDYGTDFPKKWILTKSRKGSPKYRRGCPKPTHLLLTRALVLYKCKRRPKTDKLECRNLNVSVRKSAIGPQNHCFSP